MNLQFHGVRIAENDGESNVNMKMIGWSVLVVPDPPQETTVSGIALAQRSRLPPSTGRIVSISDEALKTYPELRVGMRLHYKPFGGTQIEWEGNPWKLLREEDVLAIIENVKPVG